MPGNLTHANSASQDENISRWFLIPRGTGRSICGLKVGYSPQRGAQNICCNEYLARASNTCTHKSEVQPGDNDSLGWWDRLEVALMQHSPHATHKEVGYVASRSQTDS